MGFYNKWGTVGQWIEEGQQAVKMAQVNCHRFRSKEVRLWLSVLACNLANLWRRWAVPSRIDNGSLTSLQQPRVKTDGRLVKDARSSCLLLAEGHLTRRLLGPCWGGSRPYPPQREGKAHSGSDLSDERAGEGRVLSESVEREAVSELAILRSVKTGPFCRRWRLRTLRSRQAIALRSG